MSSIEEAQPHESKLYYEFAHLYDRIFSRVFYPRIAAVVQSLNIPPGAKVLEVGVGTGLSLDVYPHHCSVTGVDLAPDMLEIAQEKVDQHGWRHIKLQEMDALNMTFADSTFDYVMAFHVVSVVPDPARLMSEISRVCKKDGTVVVINHFRSRNPIASATDSLIAPITRRLGWRTLENEDVFGNTSIEPRRLYKTSRYSLFTIAVAENRKS
jgi:phosphatidylethanolamine/phosphatidyl-N-methylethanolamine N-methyltransferase